MHQRCLLSFGGLACMNKLDTHSHTVHTERDRKINTGRAFWLRSTFLPVAKCKKWKPTVNSKQFRRSLMNLEFAIHRPISHFLIPPSVYVRYCPHFKGKNNKNLLSTCYSVSICYSPLKVRVCNTLFV